jgi:hypothetical protein
MEKEVLKEVADDDLAGFFRVMSAVNTLSWYTSDMSSRP